MTSPLALFLLLAVLSHLDLILGPYAFVDFYDTIEVHFGHFRNMADLWLQHGFFAWYPFNAGGVPSFVGQHPPYHPAVFLSMIMPIWALASLWSIGQLVLAGWGMHRLLRKFFEATDEVATACSGIFATSFVGSNMHIVFPYAFPAFAVWTLEAFSSEYSRRDRVLRVLGLFLITLLSFPVLTLPHFAALHLLLVVCFLRHRADHARQIVAVFLVWTGYVLVFLPSIYSLYQYIPFAQRDWGFPSVTTTHALRSFLRVFWSRTTELHVFSALLFSLPLLRRHPGMRATFVLVVLSLAVAAVFGSDAKNLLANTFFVKMDLFLTTMIAQIAALIFVCQSMQHLRGVQAIPRTCLLLGVVSIFLVRGEYGMLRSLFAFTAWLFMLYVVRSYSLPFLPRRISLYIALMATGLAGMVMMDRQQYMSSTTFVPYTRGFANREALAALEFEEKAGLFRVAEIDIHPATLQAHGLDTVGGKGPLFNKYYKQYVRSAISHQLARTELGKSFDSVWRQLYLTHSRNDHDRRPLELAGPQRSPEDFSIPLLESMNVRYLVSARALDGMEGWGEFVTQESGVVLPAWLQNTWLGSTHIQPLWIYRLNWASGLGSLRSAEVVSDGASMQKWLTASAPEHLRSAVALSREDLPPEAISLVERSNHVGSGGNVVLASWGPDRLLFNCSLEESALLYVPNNHDPGWSATVNGSPAPVLRANGAFQAVPLNGPGKAQVELVYHNPLLGWLHLGSLIGVVLMSIGICYHARVHDDVTNASPVREVPLPFKPRLCLMVGAGVAIVWLAGYMFFILRRHGVGSQDYDAMLYAMGAIPFLGIGTGLWSAFLARRM